LIKSWFDDPYDTALSELAPMLSLISSSKVEDVRKELNSLKNKMAN
jgi:TFIIF-interacting CTD phosphatase-like protein